MKNKENRILLDESELTRKEAILKAGKYAAFTAATMLIVLSPKVAPAQSSPTGKPIW